MFQVSYHVPELSAFRILPPRKFLTLLLCLYYFLLIEIKTEIQTVFILLSSFMKIFKKLFLQTPNHAGNIQKNKTVKLLN